MGFPPDGLPPHRVLLTPDKPHQVSTLVITTRAAESGQCGPRAIVPSRDEQYEA